MKVCMEGGGGNKTWDQRYPVVTEKWITVVLIYMFDIKRLKIFHWRNSP